MNASKILLTLSVAGLLMGGTAAPASADEIPPVTLDAVRSVSVTGNFTGVLVNGLTVVYDCAAAATGDAVSVAITDCYITTGSKNSRIALPGPVATVADTDRVPLDDFSLCFRAVATFTDSSTEVATDCTATLPANAPQLAGTGVATTAA